MGDQAESVNLLGKDQVNTMSQFTGSFRSTLHEYIYLLLKSDESPMIF